jgi:hypothetical protein
VRLSFAAVSRYDPFMRTLLATLALAAASALPALSEEPPAGSGSVAAVEEGFSLLERGARMIMRSMIDEMEPALRDAQRELGQSFEEWGPALAEVLAKVGDLSAYHAPEVLPNGDILIRKKRHDERAFPGETFGPEGQTDL